MSELDALVYAMFGSIFMFILVVVGAMIYEETKDKKKQETHYKMLTRDGFVWVKKTGIQKTVERWKRGAQYV